METQRRFRPASRFAMSSAPAILRPVHWLAGALLMLSLCHAGSALSAGNGKESLDDQIQSLKKDVIALNRDLFVLEEDLLYPASTQVAVFVSLDVGKFFNLDSVQLKIDNKLVSSYLYTPREVQALQRGGVQRLYMGNLKAGSHELVAIYTGKGPHGRDYRRGANLTVEKGLGARYVELKIVDNPASEQPDFSIRQWD
jgi:hypothetical protein